MTDNNLIFGVSQPISLTDPDSNDLKLSKDLTEFLLSKDLIESENELQKRIDVLCSITSHVKEFIRIVTKQKMIGGEDDSHDYGGKIFTLGSYRLGVHNRGADIDTLCVAPRHVDRKDFFKVFYDLLAVDPNVTDLHAVEDAFVPVIKLMYSGIELDILFARLALKEIPDNQSLTDDNILKNLDEKSIRSLNGSRVASEILNNIPKPDMFVITLRSIKYWATMHGIYSNVLGYFGGISWAILVARICQLYPTAAPAKLLQKFFYVFKQWVWPSPVFLKDIDVNRQEISSTLTDMVWDPRIRASDRLHLMPIITPAYPEQNSTYNVTNSTKKIITFELEQASDIMEEIYCGRESWDKLFEPVNFFTKYKHFVAVLCCAKDEVDHLNYVGFIESRMRFLTAAVERHDAVVLVQVYTKQFKPINLDRFSIDYENPVSCVWFLGLSLDQSLAKALDLTTEITQFMTTVNNQQAATPQRYNEFMKIDVKYVPQKEIKYYLSRDDFLYGRRHTRQRQQLTRMPSDVVNIAANTKTDDEANGTKSANMDISTTSIENDSAERNGSILELPSNNVLNFGAESLLKTKDSGAKPMEVETRTKPVAVVAPVKSVFQEANITDDKKTNGEKTDMAAFDSSVDTSNVQNGTAERNGIQQMDNISMDEISSENKKPHIEVGVKRAVDEETADDTDHTADVVTEAMLVEAEITLERNAKEVGTPIKPEDASPQAKAEGTDTPIKAEDAEAKIELETEDVETAVEPAEVELSNKDIEIEQPVKAALQETINGIPMETISPENIKPLAELGIKRAVDEETADGPAAKKLRPDVTVA